jgi:class 3 adenylate cyclase
MAESSPRRKIAVILATDVVGYSTKMEENEDQTIKNLKVCRSIIDGLVDEHHGRIFNTAGDSVLADFQSAVEAVICASEFQNTIKERNNSVPQVEQMEFRIGINMGDVVIEGDNLYGEGVNVAARLEALAQPGGVCLSKNVHEIVNKKTDFQFHDLGEQTVKNTVLHAVDVTLNGNLKENFQNPKLEECISDMSLEQVIPYLRAGDLVWTDIDDQSHFDRALNKIYPSIKQQQNLKQVAK